MAKRKWSDTEAKFAIRVVMSLLVIPVVLFVGIWGAITGAYENMRDELETYFRCMKDPLSRYWEFRE